ncbi:DNA-binding protein [Streptomyces cyaneofuscatus]|uniref:DNA-binding protein n=1 Tax=Streptomyces cyaneofuscatus TaxID=66883 RepID=UPI003652578D
MTDRPAEPEDDFPHGAGNPARSALRHAGYTRLAQLTDVTAAEVLALHGVGPKAIRVLREALAAKGQSFAGE